MGDILKMGEYIEINGARVNCVKDIEIKGKYWDPYYSVTITFDAESIDFDTLPEIFGPTYFKIKQETTLRRMLEKVKKGIRDSLILKLHLKYRIGKLHMRFRKKRYLTAEERSHQDSDTS